MVAAGAEGPALAAEVPQSGEEHAGVLRVDRDGAAARGEVRTREDQVPAPAAVGRLVEPAIGTVAPELARRAGIDHVGDARIDGDLRDQIGLLKPHAGPTLAAIDRLVDAVSDGNGIARPGLAGPDPDDLGVPGIDLYRSDRLDRLLVEDRLERRAAVLALPHPAARRGNVEQGLAATLRPAIAEMRPLMVAEPMLRALSPEMTPASTTALCAIPLSGGGRATSGAGFCGGGIPPGPRPAGNRNSSSSAWTLPSALSNVNRCVFGPPLRPDSTEVGIQTPLTCAYAPKSVSVTRSEPRILRSLTRRISRK